MSSADNRHAPNADGIDLSLLSVSPNTSGCFNLDSPAPSAQEGKSETNLAPAKEAIAELVLSAEQLAIIFSFLSPEDTMLARVVCPTWRDAALTSYASCNTEVDNVTLKRQKNHVEMHETMSKERAAELRDEILFRQPEGSHLGDCPICFLPMPIDETQSTMTMYPCCGKVICKGCDYANFIREMKQRFKRKCPFCRKPFAKTHKECDKRLMERAEANDPAALRKMGDRYYEKGDYDSAFEYWTRAAGLGNALAHSCLASMYFEGESVEKDEEKEIYHWEEAAIAGHPKARYNLGCDEYVNKRYDRAVKHWIIAANLGHDDSLHNLKEGYKDGHVSKDDLEAALRAHQAAVDAMKSPQREAAEKIS